MENITDKLAGSIYNNGMKQSIQSVYLVHNQELKYQWRMDQ